MSIRTVAELRNALEGLPGDWPIGLSVYNHSWYANCHPTTHGEISLDMGQFSSGQRIAILHTGEWPTDGYMIRQLKG